MTYWCRVHGEVKPVEIPYRVRRITGQGKGKRCPICSGELASFVPVRTDEVEEVVPSTGAIVPTEGRDQNG